MAIPGKVLVKTLNVSILRAHANGEKRAKTIRPKYSYSSFAPVIDSVVDFRP